jgi:hypothetical protein
VHIFPFVKRKNVKLYLLPPKGAWTFADDAVRLFALNGTFSKSVKSWNKRRRERQGKAELGQGTAAAPAATTFYGAFMVSEMAVELCMCVSGKVMLSMIGEEDLIFIRSGRGKR